MTAPAYSSEQLDALARVFAEAALEELLREADAEIALPGKGSRSGTFAADEAAS